MELLIAIVIMGTAVSVMVVAMGSLTVASQQAKGSAVAEDLSHTYAEAIQDKVSFTTTLTSDIAATGTPASITVADASGFKSSPTNDLPMDILIDQEVFSVKSISGNTLTVKGRAQAGTSAAAHSGSAPTSASVMQYFICPTAVATPPINGNDKHVGYLSPDNFAFPKDAATPPNTLATASIVEVDYVNDPVAGTFTSPNDVIGCLNNYQDACPADTFRPECDPGLERIDIRVQTLLPNLQNVTTDGWVMVRRGSN